MEEIIREPLLDEESRIQIMEVGELLEAQDAHIKDTLERNGRHYFICGVASGVIFEFFALAFVISGYLKIRHEDSPDEDEVSFLDWMIDSNVDLFSITLISCLGFYFMCISFLRISCLKMVNFGDSQIYFALGYMVRKHSLLSWINTLIGIFVFTILITTYFPLLYHTIYVNQ